MSGFLCDLLFSWRTISMLRRQLLAGGAAKGVAMDVAKGIAKGLDSGVNGS